MDREIVKNRFLSLAEIFFRGVAGEGLELFDEVGLVIESGIITQLGQGTSGVVIFKGVLKADN